jgi:hypothetical protein
VVVVPVVALLLRKVAVAQLASLWKEQELATM